VGDHQRIPAVVCSFLNFFSFKLIVDVHYTWWLYLAIFGLLSTRCSSLAYPNKVKRAKIISDLARKRGATAISEQHGMSATAASKPGVFSTSCPIRSSNSLLLKVIHLSEALHLQGHRRICVRMSWFPKPQSLPLKNLRLAA
jgi:hypothetical protein